MSDKSAKSGRNQKQKFDPETYDGSTPLPSPQQELYVKHRSMGDSQRVAYRKAYKNRTGKDLSIDQKASRLERHAHIRARLAFIQRQAADETVMSVRRRKQLLTQVAEENLTAKMADYVEAGADGVYVSYGKESPNQGAVQEITSRTEMAEEGSGRNDAVVTNLKLHSRGVGIDAIKELNRMERIGVDTIEPNVTIVIKRPW